MHKANDASNDDMSPSCIGKQATVQTIKDRRLVSERIRKNEKYYYRMEHALNVILNGKTRKNDLLAYAKEIIQKNNLRLERLMKRSKPVLICWFCEHMDLIPLLKELILKQEMVEKYGPQEAFSSSPIVESESEKTQIQTNALQRKQTKGGEMILEEDLFNFEYDEDFFFNFDVCDDIIFK